MGLSAQDIQNIIERVTQQILGTEQNDDRPGGILAVFSDCVFDPQGVKTYFEGKQVICALPDGIQPLMQECKTLRLNADKPAIPGVLASCEEIVLVTPPLSLLQAIAQADDSTFTSSLVLRPLLWGKKVNVLLDFESPRHIRGTALALIAESIDALENMGIGIKILPRKNKTKQAKELVTEQDIKDACRDGSMKVIIAPGAIVTQLAQDTARECNVSIEY